MKRRRWSRDHSLLDNNKSTINPTKSLLDVYTFTSNQGIDPNRILSYEEANVEYLLRPHWVSQLNVATQPRVVAPRIRPPRSRALRPRLVRPPHPPPRLTLPPIITPQTLPQPTTTTQPVPDLSAVLSPQPSPKRKRGSRVTTPLSDTQTALWEVNKPRSKSRSPGNKRREKEFNLDDVQPQNLFTAAQPVILVEHKPDKKSKNLREKIPRKVKNMNEGGYSDITRKIEITAPQPTTTTTTSTGSWLYNAGSTMLFGAKKSS